MTSTGLRVFRDAVAIVTGAASGIGKALADELAARGCQVVGADVDFAPGGGPARDRARSATQLDVRDAPAFRQLVSETLNAYGRLDFLFNNAGISAGGEVADFPLEDWRRIVDVNLFGVIHGIHAAYPPMRAQGFGHIVNTASMQGLHPAPFTAAYSTTKHAVVGLSKALRAEAAAAGVRVSVLCPGVIRTPLLSGGRHGILLPGIPEARQRELTARFFERFRPMDPAVFARKVLDAVARNAAIIVVPAWWRVLWWIERASPTLSLHLAERAMERTLRPLMSEARGRSTTS